MAILTSSVETTLKLALSIEIIELLLVQTFKLPMLPTIKIELTEFIAPVTVEFPVPPPKIVTRFGTI